MGKTKIEGLKVWEAWAKTVSPKVAKETKEAVATSGLKIQTEARWNAPVDTGRLEGSIVHEFLNGGLTVIVFTNVEYALAVELGTVHQGAQPYLIPAFDKEYRNFTKVLKDIAEGAVD